MNAVLRILCCLLLIAQPLYTAAQAPYLLHFVPKDGLASHVNYRTIQDSRGFLWICTDQGVCRYDGHEFKTFSAKDGLPDNEVVNIQEDRWHRLWLICYSGHPCYLLNDKVYNSSNDSLCRAIERTGLSNTFIFFNEHHDLCLSGNTSVLVDSNRISAPYPGVSLENVAYHFVHRSRPYIVDHLGLGMVKGNRLQYLFTPRQYGRYPAHYFRNTLFLYGEKEHGNVLYVITLGRDSISAIQEVPVGYRIYNMLEQDDTTMLLGTDRGVIRYFLSSRKADTTVYALSGLSVSNICKDQAGNFWYGTLNNGQYLYPYTAPLVYNRQQGLSGDNVLTLCRTSSNSLVAGYDDGVVDIIGPGGIRTFSLGIRSGRNRILKCAATKDLVIAGSDCGFFFIRGDQREPISKHNVKSVYLKNDTCYTASSAGAMWQDINTRQQELIWKNRTMAIARDDAGITWLGTLEGIYCAGKNGVTRFNADPLLSQSRITDIEFAGNNVIIGTHQNGLFIWNRKRLFHIDEPKGLSNNCCKNLCTDDQQNIWVCTNKGLDKVAPDYNTGLCRIRHFSPSDGVPYNGINDVVVDAGKVYTATSEGIIVFERDKVRDDRPPAIYLTSVQAGDSSFFPGERFEVAYGKGLQINFTGVSLSDGQDLTYKYILLGAGSDTVYTRLSSVNFSTIKPGDYTFLVWARNRSMLWSPQGARCSFTIHPPFWQATWFRILAILVLASAVYLLYRRRVSVIRKREEEKTVLHQRMTELEMQALRAQINPHFVFNALNSIQHYYNQNDERAANRYMTAFAQLIRQSFTHSQTHWVTLKEETELLRSYLDLEQMRFRNLFRYEIRTASLNAGTVWLPAMILQPYIENAINHGLRHLSGCEGRLLVGFEQVQEELVCVVEDNGIGFARAAATEPKPELYQSRGMEITRKRIETINQLYHTHIRVAVSDRQEKGPGMTGTRIEIRIPIYHNQES